jgi:hypothetical protein
VRARPLGPTRTHLEQRHDRVRATSIQNALLDGFQATSDTMKNRLGLSIDSKRLPRMPVLQSPASRQREMLRASRSGLRDVGGEYTYRRPPRYQLIAAHQGDTSQVANPRSNSGGALSAAAQEGTQAQEERPPLLRSSHD